MRQWRSLPFGFALLVAPMVAIASCGNPVVEFVSSAPVADSVQGFTEPSGLALSLDGSQLWSVSDDTPALFALNFDGVILQRIDLDESARDLEGVAVQPSSGRVLVLREGSADVQSIDPDTGLIQTYTVATMSGGDRTARKLATSDPNDRLEGIALAPDEGAVFVLKEKRDRLLLRLSNDLTAVSAMIELTPKLGYDVKGLKNRQLDVSGLAVDDPTGCLWIVSDRGKRLFLADRSGQIRHSFQLGWLDDGQPELVAHAEGIAYGPQLDRLFIVNDDGAASRLFTYQITR